MNYKCLFAVSIIIGFALLASLCLPTPSPTKADTPPTELIDQRTRTTKTFYLGDNRYAIDASIGSIHYKDDPDDPNELWKDIETDIVPSDRPNWDWEVVKGNWHLLIKNDTTVALGKNGHWIGFRYQGFGYLDSVTREYHILQTANDVTPVVEGNTIRWEGLFYGTNLEYVYGTDGFKENLEVTQVARDWLSAHPPSSYQLSNQTTYLVGYLECGWRNAYPAEYGDNIAINWDNVLEFESESIFFRHPIKEKIITALPIGWARHDNLEPQDWIPIRKRFYEQNDKNWLLFGASVVALNQMPPGTIILDPTVNEQVGASTDDVAVYWNGSAWGIQVGLDWAWIIAGYSSASDLKYGSGLRFTSVSITKPAVIDTAYLTITAVGSYSNTTVNTKIIGDDEDDAATFSTIADYQARRGTSVGGADNTKRTTAEVLWDNISGWTVNTEYDSPEIKTVIQEIVDRAGWSSGNSLVLFWDDHDARGTQSSAVFRPGHSWDSDPTKAAKLHIEYTVIVAPTVTTANATNVEDTSATLNGNITDTGGENCDYRGFEWGLSSGNYSANWTEGGSFGTGSFSHGITNLSDNTTYYYRAMAHNSAGWGYGNEVSFTTDVTSSTLDPPTNFTLTQTDADEVTITWTKEASANTTIIRLATGNYPSSPDDDWGVYNGTGENIIDTGLNLSMLGYYYRAWSWNNTIGYSTEYAQGNIGGDEMEALALSIGNLSDTFSSMAGNLVMILPLLFFSALAFWKENQVLFILTGAISMATGLYWYDAFTNNLGLTIGLVMIAYCLFCFGLAFRLMFWHKEESSDR